MKRQGSILLGLLVLVSPAAVQGRFTYTTNGGAITLSNYDGTGGAVTISNFVTSIGTTAFVRSAVTSVTIPASVTNIGQNAFASCTSLTNITIPASVTSIGVGAFFSCARLVAVFFTGTAPGITGNLFGAPPDEGFGAVYYLPGTTGWSNSFAGYQALLWDAQDQYGYTTNNNTVTIARYLGSGGAVVVPVTISGLPVANIGTNAFEYIASVTSITISGSVSIAEGAFAECIGLTVAVIGNSVTNIAVGAFANCSNLTNVIFGNGPVNVAANAFFMCTSLTDVYFTGNYPDVSPNAFVPGVVPPKYLTIYYLPGTSGWPNSLPGTTITNRLWNPEISTGDANFGVQNGQFGFNITNTANLTVVVEACTNLANPVWVPLATNTLVNGTYYFSEPVQTSGEGRFYGLGFP